MEGVRGCVCIYGCLVIECGVWMHSLHFVRSCNHFSSVSCTKLLWSLELPTIDATTFRDALPAKRCTCRSGWSQRAFKHCLVALYRDRGICSSKDACLFLLKRPPAPGMLESNVVCQLEPSVNETDAVVFYHGTTISEGLSSIYSSPLLHLQLPVSP